MSPSLIWLPDAPRASTAPPLAPFLVVSTLKGIINRPPPTTWEIFYRSRGVAQTCVANATVVHRLRDDEAHDDSSHHIINDGDSKDINKS